MLNAIVLQSEILKNQASLLPKPFGDTEDYVID